MQADTLSAVPGALTEQAISFSYDIQPRSKWHRFLQANKYTKKYFPKQKQYQIRPIVLAILELISGHLLSIDVKLKNDSTLDLAYQLMNKHTSTVVKVIALAIHNKRGNVPKGLEEELRYNLTPTETLSLLMIVLQQMNIQNFLTTIVSMRGLNVLEAVKPEEEKSGA